MATLEGPAASDAASRRRHKPLDALFRRRQPDEPTAPPPISGIACSMRACSNLTAQQCAYRDARGRVCRLAYCPGHSVAVDGVSYCRRHAGVVRAIGSPLTQRGGLPDVDNRAPSLVNWIARDLDTNVLRLLAGAARQGETVLADDTVHIARDYQRQARWEQSWRLVDHTGLILKVTIQVQEDNDSRVHVRVGSGMVATAIPPWIARRGEDNDIEASMDISQRNRFYMSLDESIFMAVDKFRAERKRSGR